MAGPDSEIVALVHAMGSSLDDRREGNIKGVVEIKTGPDPLSKNILIG